MTHAVAGHYAKKHATGAIVDPVIQDALLKRAIGQTLPCAVAFDVAKHLKRTPEEIGQTADLLELRLVKCQLGLFGYGSRKTMIKPAAAITPALEKAIRETLVDDRLPCKRAWEIAETLGIHKMKVSAACNAVGIKIRPCQLGAF